MDKSLKHLSRLDLLELMIKLSEENEAITAENEQLRKMLAVKPSLSRATKVGSIAELALQANGYFEAAQRSADDYLREIKRMRDQLAQRAGAAEQASQPAVAQRGQVAGVDPADPVIVNAKSQARAIVNKANIDAAEILDDARKKAEVMLADANRRSRSIVSRANHQADAVMQSARADAELQQSRYSMQGQPAQNKSAQSKTASNSANRQVQGSGSGYGRHARLAEGR